MGKITGKLKHTVNAFPDLQTKFLHKQYIIWSFLPNFNEFHQNFHLLKISGTFQEQLTMSKKVKQEVSPTKHFQIHLDKSIVSLS